MFTLRFDMRAPEHGAPVAWTHRVTGSSIYARVSSQLYPKTLRVVRALGIHQPTLKKFVSDIESGGLTETLSKRDSRFGDYRTSEGDPA